MKIILLSLLGTSFLGMLLVTINFFSMKPNNSRQLKVEQLMNKSATPIFEDIYRTTYTPEPVFSSNPPAPFENTLQEYYSFENPRLAYQLLQKLDIFENGQTDLEKAGMTFKKKKYFGISINNDYCDDHRAHFAYNPDTIFEEKLNYMSEYWDLRVRNHTLNSFATDLHPEIYREMPKNFRLSYAYPLDPEINIFYTFTLMYRYRLLGKHFSCLTQISNHCPGHENLSEKDKVGEALVEYSKQYKSRPECFSTDKFFPETWVMYKADQCKEFFKQFNSPEYLKLKAERKIVYIRKIGADVHEGKGVFPVTDPEEKLIRNLYDNGKKCGKVEDNNIIQAFVHNPLLVENRKFHFRVYLYIASVNPFIAYYHDGYLRISFQEYDTSSNELGAFITNLGMTDILFQDEEGVGERSAADLKEDSYWYIPQFQKYMMERGLVTDPNWADNHLRAEIKRAMVHLVRMSQNKFWKKSSVFELYGVDFMMDENLNLWFIEANSKPLIWGWNDETVKMFDEILHDSLEISIGLLRSRAKRIINYINGIIRDQSSWELKQGEVVLKQLKKRQEEFKQVSMNRFEPEFKPSKKNGFVPIIDENQKGTKKYYGLLKEKCL